MNYPKQLFDANNKLSIIDFFVYFNLIEKFSEVKTFNTSTELWNELKLRAEKLNLPYRATSIRTSFYKLTSTDLITKKARSEYSINGNIFQNEKENI